MLTVLMATRNRAPLLRRVLESYWGLEEPEGGWKIVLVDNGSTDETRRVAALYADFLPLEYVYEKKPGQSSALNRGLSHVSGDLVVKTDDDTFPHRDWLVQLRRAANENPQCGIFGGAILPEWEVPLEGTLHSLLPHAVLYALTDPQMKEGVCPANFVFGPNMAIRPELFEAGYQFDESVGPLGRSYPMGTETTLLMELARGGVLAWFVPGAAVRHFIRKEQLSLGWMFRRAVNFGRGQCLKTVKSEASPCPVMLGVPRYLFKRVLRQSWDVLKNAVILRRPEVVEGVWQLMFLKGFMEEARHHPWRS